jgi:reticulon-4-interacting protein 1, mitochondrial
VEHMQQAVLHRYGPAPEVLNIEQAPRPRIGKNEVLVRQYASSVNPIDSRMRGGYGRVIVSKLRGFEFPLVLGRDVSGEVVEVGRGVTGLSVGDAVYGTSRAKDHGGAHAELVVSTSNDLVAIPTSLSFIEAAAFPYVAGTIWAAFAKAGLNERTAAGKKVFVQAGSGGIGSLAIQVLKAWGAFVATTCSGANAESVRALGADVVVDYEQEDYAKVLFGFDVALETIGGALEDKTLGILRKDGHGCFVTLIHPLLRNFDESGMVRGAVKNLIAVRAGRRHAQRQGVPSYHWVTFKPSTEALLSLRELIDDGRVRPHIDSVFDFAELVQAHERCESGNANGKIIVRLAGPERPGSESDNG